MGKPYGEGYGCSSGSQPDIVDTYADIAAVVDHLVTVRGADPRRVVLYGQSIGGVTHSLNVSTYKSHSKSLNPSVASLSLSHHPLTRCVFTVGS